MLSTSKPVLGGHPVLSGHYSIPRGCPLDTGLTVVHKLSPSYLQKPAYGSMPLEPAETTHRFNFPESRVAFSMYNQLS